MAGLILIHNLLPNFAPKFLYFLALRISALRVPHVLVHVYLGSRLDEIRLHRSAR